MILYSDSDIKIAGNKPSREIDERRKKNSEQHVPEKDKINNAKELGCRVAAEFIKDAKNSRLAEEPEDFEMTVQRRLLLSFTATVGFEQYCSDDTLCGIAQKSFIDTLKKNDSELYKSSNDTGVFSFYYLAYRRGNEIDRRIGQTFAMLCSHDGDPVYQELGEALYCWFLSNVKKIAAELGLYVRL